jgi:dynein light intermediate chain
MAQSLCVIPMTERVKGNLLKYEVPVLAGNNDFKKKAKLPTNSNAPTESLTRDTLNSILPPREFRENNEDLIQYVSTTPAAKSDVVKLQQQLDAALQQRKARETGLCPIRSELYGQCFDEIIRQVTIDCSARGLLLVRVRDDMRATMSCYQLLYESAITWGMRKSMQLEQAKDERTAENASLKDQVNTLREKNAELKAKIEEIEKREADFRAQREKEHQDETTFLKRQSAQLKAQLEQLLTK